MRFFLALIVPLFQASVVSAADWPGPRIVEVFPLLDEDDADGGWKPAPFAFEADVHWYEGVLSIGLGDYLTGAVWKGGPPSRMNYEIELEARRGFGSDFFLGLTVPVGDAHCTWICGGWGGRVVGISDIDGLSADRNETSTRMDFKGDRWYRFKIRVLEERIQCWIDAKRVVDVNIKGKRISMRPGRIEQSIPLGISTYDTEGKYRNIEWRNLATPETAGPTVPAPVAMPRLDRLADEGTFFTRAYACAGARPAGSPCPAERARSAKAQANLRTPKGLPGCSETSAPLLRLP